MKLTTHILGLIVVFIMFSTIACSKKDDNPQATAAKCMAMAGCPQEFMARMNASQATQNLAMNGLNANGAPTLLPPVANGQAPTQLSNNTGAPAPVIPRVIASISDSALRQEATKVARQMAQASANPNSSYYVDPNAEDIPARNSNDISTVPTVQSANRGPASVEPSSGTNVTQ